MRIGIDLRRLPGFRRDERGTTAIIFGLALVPAIVLAGGAIDFITAVNVRTKLQAAADSAVLAGASMGPGVGATERGSRTIDVFGANKGAELPAPVTAQVTVDGDTVSLTSSTSVTTSFLKIVHIDTFAISVAARAKSTYTQSAAAPGKVCLLALDPNSDDGIHIQGANVVDYRDCWGYANSQKPTAINGTGNSSSAIGAGHCAVGGYSATHNNFTPVPLTGCVALADPFASVSAYATSGSYAPNFTPPAIPDTCKANSLSLKKGTFTLDPGRYCGGMNFQAQATVALNPGVYIIDNGELNVQSGANLSGNNVLLYFTGPNAHFTIIGGGTINLKGRGAGWSYAGFLFIADANAWRGQSSNIQGGGTFNLEGLLYMPTQRIEVAGNGDVNGNTNWFGMIAKDFYFRGNGRFYLKNYGGSTALPDIMPTTPPQQVLSSVALK